MLPFAVGQGPVPPTLSVFVSVEKKLWLAFTLRSDDCTLDSIDNVIQL